MWTQDGQEEGIPGIDSRDTTVYVELWSEFTSVHVQSLLEPRTIPFVTIEQDEFYSVLKGLPLIPCTLPCVVLVSPFPCICTF